MIAVNLDKLKLPYIIISPDSMKRSLENHCDKTKCAECKYELKPYKNCEITYILEHNLIQVNREKYIIINDEERHLIINQNAYCRDAFCARCRYNQLICNEDGEFLGCNIARLIAHRIIKKEITKDQYEVRDIEPQST